MSAPWIGTQLSTREKTQKHWHRQIPTSTIKLATAWTCKYYLNVIADPPTKKSKNVGTVARHPARHLQENSKPRHRQIQASPIKLTTAWTCKYYLNVIADPPTKSRKTSAPWLGTRLGTRKKIQKPRHRQIQASTIKLATAWTCKY